MCSAIPGGNEGPEGVFKSLSVTARDMVQQETWFSIYDVRTQSGHRARRQCAAAVAVLTRRVTNPAGMGGRSLSGAGVEPQTLLFTHRLLLLVLPLLLPLGQIRLAVLVGFSQGRTSYTNR